ncbi:hypothetical protein HY947_03940 [Candidatus Gottesmanbacteria bacterium]|nr:hypothetical protein [Candidatus Gottesmanbacteria bacterium]
MNGIQLSPLTKNTSTISSNLSTMLDIHTIIVYSRVYMIPSPVSRINISLSEDVLMMLKKYVPERGLSRFLTEAAGEKIDRMKREKALKTLLAAPPSLRSFGDARTYIHRLRRGDEKRLKRLGI